MSADLAQRVQMAFDRCKEFPEAGVQGGMFHVRGDAYLALIELRNLCPQIVLALRSGNEKSASDGWKARAHEPGPEYPASISGGCDGAAR